MKRQVQVAGNRDRHVLTPGGERGRSVFKELEEDKWDRSKKSKGMDGSGRGWRHGQGPDHIEIGGLGKNPDSWARFIG